MKNYLKDFLYELEFTEEKKYNTVISMRNDIERFLDYFFETPLEEIDYIFLKKYLKDLEKKVSPSTYNRNIASIKQFYKFLKKKNIIKNNPTLMLDNVKDEKKEIEYISLDDIKKIRATMTGEDFSSLRDKLMFELIFSSGITVLEMLSLGKINFNVDEREIYILKSTNERTVFFSKYCKEIFLKYLEKKKEKFKEEDSDDILFVNSSNKRITDRSVRRIIQKYAEKSEIEKDVSPYVLRHTFGIYMLKKGMPEINLKYLLGMKNMETIEEYKKIIKKEDL